MSHATHYTKAGANWYTQFVYAELAEIAAHLGGNDVLNPYGRGTTANSPIIALGEGWAYHAGHFLADQRFGFQSSNIGEQGETYTSNSPVNGLSSHLNLLEDFDPVNRRAADPFSWIPQGLLYDLMDNRNDNNTFPFRVPLNDVVSGYTNQQFCSALQSDVTSLQQFRARLLSQNGNSQATGVNSIFAFYGY